MIDTSYALRGPSGTATYLDGLIGALGGLDDVEVLEAAQPRRLAPGRAGGGRNPARSAVNLALDLAWLQTGLPTAARKAGAELIHHPLPAYAPAWPGPQVVTVHDLAFERLPDRFDPWWRLPARRSHMRAAQRCAAVICVSAGTARDVASRWGIPEGRIVVAPHGAPAAAQEVPEGPGDGHGYFLYVGDAEPRKNLGALLAAHALYRADERDAGRAPLDLVLAGSAASLPSPSEGVRRAESPDQADLRRLLHGATALVHPALHEGFGLTALEAMAAGTPVIAARAAGTVEVCAEAAAYFDPRDPRALAARMLEVAADPVLAGRLAAAGRARAAELTWDESARRHRDAYILALR